MGLTIAYTIRLARRTAVPDFLRAARAAASGLGWKAPRAAPGKSTLELHAHPKCEPVLLDFSRSLTCEAVVKTSSAPLRTHVQVVEFLRTLQPLAKSMTVEDECEYWETGDKTRLKEHRAAFARAMGRARAEPADQPIRFTIGAIVVTTKRGPGA